MFSQRPTAYEEEEEVVVVVLAGVLHLTVMCNKCMESHECHRGQKNAIFSFLFAPLQVE